MFCQATDGQSTPTVCNSLGLCMFRTALAHPCLVFMSRITVSRTVTPSISVALPLYMRQTLNRRLSTKPDVIFGPQGLCFGGRVLREPQSHNGLRDLLRSFNRDHGLTFTSVRSDKASGSEANISQTTLSQSS